MSETSLLCPKCDSQMERGFIVDQSHGAMYPSTWAAGEPQRSFWTVTKMPPESFAVGTFRCSSCGYLESYARPEFATKKDG